MSYIFATVPTAVAFFMAPFDRLRVHPEEKKSILIIGGAGGVGSIMTQLAKQLTNLTVIAAASRPETELWVRDMSAFSLSVRFFETDFCSKFRYLAIAIYKIIIDYNTLPHFLHSKMRHLTNKNRSVISH